MSKNNKGMKILVIILSVLLAVSIGYILYDKTYQNISNNKEQNMETNENTQNNLPEVDQFKKYVDKKIAERNNNDIYINIVTNEKENSMGHPQIKLTVDKYGNAYIYDDLSSEQKTMIETKVIDAFKIVVGQAGAEQIFLILEDGTVTEINYEGTTANKNYKNLKQIVSVKSEFICGDTECMSGSYGPVFTDINGEVYKSEHTH